MTPGPVVHVRRRAERRRLGLDAAGQIRPFRGDPERDPRAKTLCGGTPTDKDLSWRDGHSKPGRIWITCGECLDAVDQESDR